MNKQKQATKTLAKNYKRRDLFSTLYSQLSILNSLSMTTLNLHEYITSGMILRNISANQTFDVVVFEKKPHLEELPEWVNIIVLEETNPGLIGIQGTISGIVASYEKVCVVLDSLKLVDIIQWISLHEEEKTLCIINSCAWLSSLLHKDSLDHHDLGIASTFDIPVFVLGIL